MKQLQFSTQIRATKEKVWKVLWEDKTYRDWTSVFSPGSYAVSDWREGSRVLFLSESGDGMYSMINEKRDNEFMSFKHLGVVKDGIEQPPTEDTASWAGAREEYTLEDSDGAVELLVSLEITEPHQAYFLEKFPQALHKVKELAEDKKIS